MQSAGRIRDFSEPLRTQRDTKKDMGGGEEEGDNYELGGRNYEEEGTRIGRIDADQENEKKNLPRISRIDTKHYNGLGDWGLVNWVIR